METGVYVTNPSLTDKQWAWPHPFRIWETPLLFDVRHSPEAKWEKDDWCGIHIRIAHQAAALLWRFLADFILDENQSCHEIRKDLLT